MIVKKERRKLYMWFTAALVFLIMGLIFFFSCQDGSQSSETSGFFTNIVISIFYPDYDSMSAADQLAVFEQTSHIVRKLGHFTEYTLLGFVLMLHAAVTVKHNNPGEVIEDEKRNGISTGCKKTENNEHCVKLRTKILLRGLFAFLIGAAYAVTDEFHQSFVGGRAAMATDVCIDSGGVLLGVIIMLFIVLAVGEKTRNARETITS